MRKVIIRKPLQVAPFNEPARDLRVLNKPLWQWQRDLLAPYCDEEVVVADASSIPRDPVEMIVHSDNLWFDEPFLKYLSARRADDDARHAPPFGLTTRPSYSRRSAP